MIAEQDFKDIKNSFGMISLMIIFIFIIYIILKVAISVLFSNGLKNPAIVYLSVAFFISLGISYISGHTLLSSSVVTYFCLIIAMLNTEIDEIRNNSKNVMFISSVGGHLTQMLTLKKIFKNNDI